MKVLETTSTPPEKVLAITTQKRVHARVCLPAVCGEAGVRAKAPGRAPFGFCGGRRAAVAPGDLVRVGGLADAAGVFLGAGSAALGAALLQRRRRRCRCAAVGPKQLSDKKGAKGLDSRGVCVRT